MQEDKPPVDEVAAYFAKNDAKLKLTLSGKVKLTPAELKAQRLAALAKGRETRRLKLAQREIVRRKVEMGSPISDEERRSLLWKGGNMAGKTEEALAMAAVSKLMIKPQSVTELRLLVESTAAKHAYNPIEGLIKLTTSPNLKDTDVIAIHKALLPFLVPQLATPKAAPTESEGGVKVTITQFVFDGKKTAEALHTERPTTVETTATPHQ